MQSYKDKEKRIEYKKEWQKNDYKRRKELLKKKGVEIPIEEPLHMEIIEDLPEAVEILTAPKKVYAICSDLYLENERLGKSQHEPPIIWKKRVLKPFSNDWVI
jgi:hypothetical protein